MTKYTAVLERIVQKQQENENLAYLLDDLVNLSTQVNEDLRQTSSAPVPLAEASQSFLRRILNGNKDIGIPTGFQYFDSMTNGLAKGELVIFGGRPGMGKTALLIQLAQNIAKHNNHVLIFSLDLTSDLLSLRFLSAISGISSYKIRKGELTENEKQQLNNSVTDLEQSSIYIDDNPSHIFGLKEKCRKLHKEGKLDVVMVDYLQMVGGSSRRNSNRELEISMICRELKNIAKEFNVCVVAGSQLSRAVESRGGDKRPQLSDLRESGAIEQDADKVIFVYRPEYYKIMEDENGNSLANIMELILAKNRNGVLANVPLEIKNDFTQLADFTEMKSFGDLVRENRMNDFKDDNEPF